MMTHTYINAQRLHGILNFNKIRILKTGLYDNRRIDNINKY